MIRRLRIKFVCINMAIVTAMLCITFGLVLHFTRAGMERDSIEMMQSVAASPHKPGIPGKRGPGLPMPHFTLQMTEGGEWIVSNSGNYALTDPNLLNELVELSSEKQSGVLREYSLRFMRISTPAGQYIVFADMSQETNMINNLLRNCLFIGAAGFFCFLIISILLARWAVKPVETAWEQQRRFVADASHELKTPLTVILSNAQLLSESGEDPVLRERLTSNILTISQQMKELVLTLLDSARVDEGIEAAEFTVFDLSDTVANAMLPFDSVFYEQGIGLDADIQDHIMVRGSQPHLAQVVNILLDNARKYGSGHTHVSLKRQGAKRCLLTVATEGAELSDEEQKNIFKRFYRADAARERTGS